MNFRNNILINPAIVRIVMSGNLILLYLANISRNNIELENNIRSNFNLFFNRTKENEKIIPAIIGGLK